MLFFQEIKELYEANRIKLTTTIDCLKSERETEQIIKEEVEKHMEELLEELEKIEEEINESKDKHGKASKQVQQKYSKVLEELLMKSEKLAAENFEYAVDNVSICLENFQLKLSFLQEHLEKKLQEISESKKLLDKELTQLRVENQWLVNNNKRSSGKQETAEDIAREIQDLKLELRNEKDKVK